MEAKDRAGAELVHTAPRFDETDERAQIYAIRAGTGFRIGELPLDARIPR